MCHGAAQRLWKRLTAMPLIGECLEERDEGVTVIGRQTDAADRVFGDVRFKRLAGSADLP